jgi:hypothetical protein
MKRNIAIMACLVLVFVLTLPAIAADQAAKLKVTVIKEETGKPVRNASVVLHPVGKDGRQSHGGTELKTDAEGNASLDGVPFGKLRIQVIARGLQTYGEDFDVNKPDQEIVIKLKPPQSQYSIYK